MKSFTIIGPGLIGASLGLILKKKKLASVIYGYDVNKDNLKDAIQIKAIDKKLNKLDKEISECDVVFICTPVGKTKKILGKLNKILTKKTIVSDVGSVKGFFEDKDIDSFKNLNIVPSHPIAGTELSGAKNAFSKLFEKKWCILTPLSNSTNVETIKKIWQEIGMKVSIMSPQEHDKIMSITSHLPHLIAFTIVGTAFKLSKQEKNKLLNFSAGGFKDFTRIGSSDPEMWKDIFLSNKEHLMTTLSLFLNDLENFASLIKNDKTSEIFKTIRRTKQIRKKIIKLS